MDTQIRIESTLEKALQRDTGDDCPPLLGEAMRYSVFPGGARMRPRLCLAVAAACGDDRPEVADSAAVAIELLHCASLVHDDLPCFDDAATRRGKPSVHKAFGAPLAVLAGDALIVAAFQQLAHGTLAAPRRLPGLVDTVARAVGAPDGIAAGQAWECEPKVKLSKYQRAKTGALFAAATMAGAQSAGQQAAPWRLLGARLGEAYQVADDIRDCAATSEQIGKPTGRDEALDRPSAVRRLGMPGAIARLKTLVSEGISSIPDCPGGAALRDLIQLETERFLPKEILHRAA